MERVLILLPPSEGKTAPESGPRLDLDSMSIPAFGDLRKQLVGELMDVSKRGDAMKVLGVGKTVEGEVIAQRDLKSLPCAPALEVYTGVLYQAAGFTTLSKEALDRASDSVLIFSALFGATSPADPIPQYRMKMGVKLPGGTPRARWRGLWSQLDERADGELVIDGRSGDYADWRPSSALTVKIGAVRDLGGTRQVITHNAKYYRGLFTRLALTADTPPTLAEDLAHLASSAGDPVIGDIELTGTGSTQTITVVERVSEAS